MRSAPAEPRAAGPDARAASKHARHLLVALALAAAALPGALPGSRGDPDPVAFLTWLAFVAAPVGALAGGMRLPAWPNAAAVPGAWMVGLVAVDALAPRDLETPLWAALAASGLFALGFALGRVLRRERGAAACSGNRACVGMRARLLQIGRAHV